MAVTAPPRPGPAPEPSAAPGLGSGQRPPGRVADNVFRWVALASGLLVLVILGLIAYFTTKEAWPWFKNEGLDAIFTDNWNPSAGGYGALALVYGTFLVGALSLLLAVPVSIGIALFVEEVAPRRIRKPIIYTIDLLAAIPSVVYGLWAIAVLTVPLADIYSSISDATSGIPIISDITANPSTTGKAYMTAGIVVAIMITPIITSITREVFATTPLTLKEASYGLGATRWEMIRGAVFPHSRGGVISAVMIGLGRAIGETIAVFLVVGSTVRLSPEIFAPGETMASIIVAQFGEATGEQRAALIGLGVVLFVFTVLVGASARAVVNRYDRRMSGGTGR
jgi:phosphate transport system permease protein